MVFTSSCIFYCGIACLWTKSYRNIKTKTSQVVRFSYCHILRVKCCCCCCFINMLYNAELYLQEHLIAVLRIRYFIFENVAFIVFCTLLLSLEVLLEWRTVEEEWGRQLFSHFPSSGMQRTGSTVNVWNVKYIHKQMISQMFILYSHHLYMATLFKQKMSFKFSSCRHFYSMTRRRPLSAMNTISLDLNQVYLLPGP